MSRVALFRFLNLLTQYALVSVYIGLLAAVLALSVVLALLQSSLPDLLENETALFERDFAASRIYLPRALL